jgi:uncharacterized membrane protein
VTVVRFLHITAFVTFVGGQLLLVLAVAPAVRRHGTDATMRFVARRFGLASAIALVVLIATGVAMASHYSLWDAPLLHAKLALLVLVGVLLALHIVSPTTRVVSYLVAAVSLLIVWLGVKLTYG